MTHPAPSVRHGGRLLALLALAGLIVATAQRIDLGRAVASLSGLRLGWIALALLGYVAILPLWAAQWRLLAPGPTAPRARDMLRVIAITSAVLNTTPLLVGEATAVVLLIARAGLDRAAALSVLAMDQLLVGAAKLCVFAMAALVAPLPSWMTRAVLTLLGVIVVAGGAALVASWRHVDVERWSLRVLPPRAASAAASFARALEPLRVARRGLAAFALALLKKGVEVGAILCVQRAFGIELPLGNAVLVLALLNLATLLPVVPGNVGVFEAAVMLALTRFGVPAEQALGVAVVQHLCFFVALATPGLIATARGR